MGRADVHQPCVCAATHIWITSTILYGLVKSRTSSERANKLLSRLARCVLLVSSPVVMHGATIESREGDADADHQHLDRVSAALDHSVSAALQLLPVT